ncbi:hypothetical protein Tco_1257820 [Tanacetum coccineum]
MANLAQLARDAKFNQLKDMLLYLFEKENELDFTLSRQISHMVWKFTDRVRHSYGLYDCYKSDPDQGAQEDFICGSDAGKVNGFGVSSCGLKKWLDIAYWDHEPHIIDYMLQRQCYVDDAHYDMPLIFYIHGCRLHFGRREFSLITGLKITSLDLIDVLEDKEFFFQNM